MTSYEDAWLASRFAALAPDPLPGDWEDVVHRARAASTERQSVIGSRVLEDRGQRRLFALAVAVLVAAVGTAAAYGVRAFLVDRGFIGLPPVGATPSHPESGELVLSWVGRSATLAGHSGTPLVRAWVYEDGRIIWSRSGSIPEGANEFTSGYLEQRLTSEGLGFLRKEVAGLLDRTRGLLEIRTNDPTGTRHRSSVLVLPSDYDWGWGSVEVPDGERLVRLRWVKGCPPPALAPGCIAPSGPAATPDQLSALRQVDALLTAPASALPTNAWDVREMRAYVPSRYAVCITTSPPKNASQLLSMLPTRAAEVLRGKIQKRSEQDVVQARDGGRVVVLGRSVTYCSTLATQEAREVADPLAGLDREPTVHGVVLAYRLAEPVKNLGPTTILFEPYFPHGQVTCSACG
jgi:hypothetical protein